jgi:hypothetical protein
MPAAAADKPMTIKTVMYSFGEYFFNAWANAETALQR